MASSGTRSVQSVRAQSLLDYAIRACGKSSNVQTAETQEAGKDALTLILQNLPNRGVDLWNIQEYIFGPLAYQKQFTLPIGTVDILNINYRYSIRPTGTVITTGTLNPYYPAQFAFDKNTDTYALFTTANGSLGLDYGVGNNQQIINVGVLPQDGKTYNLVFEYSNDNVTWTSVLATGAVTPGAKTWQYWAIDRPIPARYFRVRETNGALIAFDEVVFATVQQDIPLAALNRDDYYNLSNKDGQYGARSLQYWFDKQITPKIWLWPVPSDSFQVFSCLLHLQPEDVGNLSNSLNIPNRWLPYVRSALAYEMSFQIPGVDPSRMQTLQAKMQAALIEAERGEDDGAPINLLANVSAYTA